MCPDSRLNPTTDFQETHMTRQYTASSPFRTAFERAFAGLVFASMVALTVGGTIAMCVSGGTALVA
jgi:hypothetical protein